MIWTITILGVAAALLVGFVWLCSRMDMHAEDQQTAMRDSGDGG